MSNDTKSPYNPFACPVCVAILRIPRPKRFTEGHWMLCHCGYSILRFPCQHMVLTDPIGFEIGEEHVCPEPVNPWGQFDAQGEPVSPEVARRRARMGGRR